MPRAIARKTSTKTLLEASSQNSTFWSTMKKPQFLLLVLLIVIAILYYFKSLFIVATVNGKPISRFEEIRELEKRDGKQVVSSIITRSLVYQEAAKQHVAVKGKEVQDEMKKIESNLSKNGQKLDQALLAQGMTKAELEDQIRLEKLVEKLVGKDIKVTDKEIDGYLEKNKDQFSESNPAPSRDEIKKQLEQQKLSEKVGQWLQTLQKNAKIQYFVNF